MGKGNVLTFVKSPFFPPIESSHILVSGGYTKVGKEVLFAKRTPFREKDFEFFEKDLIIDNWG